MIGLEGREVVAWREEAWGFIVPGLRPGNQCAAGVGEGAAGCDSPAPALLLLAPSWPSPIRACRVERQICVSAYKTQPLAPLVTPFLLFNLRISQVTKQP